ncbi:uncharacterized sporulation protein YeaH/YhbH (DUF444 family) [Sphingomonas zeicaulis]|uniref:hypothetical protein n=1 Tax=Sphingomonas zeicaulis TaxID=1632740 RepID=UPI003D20BB21
MPAMRSGVPAEEPARHASEDGATAFPIRRRAIKRRCPQPDRMDKDRHMSKALKSQRAALEAEQKRLEARLKELQQREREAAIEAVERAGLLKLDIDRLGELVGRIKTLGVDEVERRLGEAGKPRAVPVSDEGGRQTAMSDAAQGLAA